MERTTPKRERPKSLSSEAGRDLQAPRERCDPGRDEPTTPLRVVRTRVLVFVAAPLGLVVMLLTVVLHYAAIGYRGCNEPEAQDVSPPVDIAPKQSCEISKLPKVLVAEVQDDVTGRTYSIEMTLNLTRDCKVNGRAHTPLDWMTITGDFDGSRLSLRYEYDKGPRPAGAGRASLTFAEGRFIGGDYTGRALTTGRFTFGRITPRIG